MNYLVLAAGTLLIIVFSWLLSLRHERYHGIPRFFAFESIFILVMLNIPFWFKNPFTPQQILSWVLMFSSIYPAVTGFLLLKRRGNPDSNFENTSQLVTTGLYKYIRHPLYLSLFLLGTGVMFKRPGQAQLILGVVNTVALWLTAKIEEREMIKKFGTEYEEYMKKSKMFIPYIL